MHDRWPGEPPAEHRWISCAGCGAEWWNDEECLCSCTPGNPRYESWTVADEETTDA